MDTPPPTSETGSRPNPFVGPRPIQTGEKIYGRERETLTLLNLLVSERIILFHSPSGAGKTSLIQAALIPLLQTRSFQILPVIRINLLPTNETEHTMQAQGKTVNRYVYSAISSLARALPENQSPDKTELAKLSLGEYLERYPVENLADNGTPEIQPLSPLYIFDQFEEVLTLDPVDQPVKRDFFEQLGKLLSDPSIHFLSICLPV